MIKQILDKKGNFKIDTSEMSEVQKDIVLKMVELSNDARKHNITVYSAAILDDDKYVQLLRTKEEAVDEIPDETASIGLNTSSDTEIYLDPDNLPESIKFLIEVMNGFITRTTDGRFSVGLTQNQDQFHNSQN